MFVLLRKCCVKLKNMNSYENSKQINITEAQVCDPKYFLEVGGNRQEPSISLFLYEDRLCPVLL